MSGKPGSSVRQRRVSAELRTLRLSRNLTCEQVGDALGWSTAKISRMETGIRGLYPEDVALVLGYLQAPAPLRDELLALVRDSHKPNWIQVGGKLPTAWKQLIDFEDSATALFNYEPLVIPGLLQTADYARAVIRAGNSELPESEVDRLVRTRMGRIAILSRHTGPTLAAIIDETVLRRPLADPSIMQAQLQHLLTMATRPRIDLRVIPFEIGATTGIEGPILILDFPDQPSLVHLETRGVTGFLEEAAVVRRVKIAWRELHSTALSPKDSTRLIADIVGDMT